MHGKRWVAMLYDVMVVGGVTWANRYLECMI